MSYSLNETEALCKRAARGAGFSWGMAAEAATAARWLASFDLPGPELLVARLTLLDHRALRESAPRTLQGTWQSESGVLCPIIAGAAMSDCRDRIDKNKPLSMKSVLMPLLIVPFAALSANDLGRCIQIEWQAVSVCVRPGALSIEGNRQDLMIECATELRCLTDLPRDATEPCQSRADIDTVSWNRLTAFAERTYAPATDESRRRGAG